MTKSPLVQVLFSVALVSLVTVLLLNREQAATMLNSQGGVRGTSAKNESIYALHQYDRVASFDPDDEDWPPLKSLIGDRETDIKQDVQFMLDFAIVGHPKTATTSTLKWLGSHREIEMHDHELHAMQSGCPAELVSLLYALPAGRNYKRGYKAPRDIASATALHSFINYFPETKLMIGLR